MIKKFEDDARNNVTRYLKIYRENPKSESAKLKYFKMKDQYMQIAKMTGEDSPSKVAVKQAVAKAKVE